MMTHTISSSKNVMLQCEAPFQNWIERERSYVQSPYRHSLVEFHTENISVSQPQRILLILMNESVQLQSVKTQTNTQNPTPDHDPTANEINHLCTRDGSILVAVNLYRNNMLL